MQTFIKVTLIIMTLICLYSYLYTQQYYGNMTSYSNPYYSNQSSPKSKPKSSNSNPSYSQYSSYSQRPQTNRNAGQNNYANKKSYSSYNAPQQLSSKNIWCRSLATSIEPNFMIMAKLLCQ